MNWLRFLEMTVRTPLRARARSLLSVSGMAVGVTAVTLMLGLGAGAKQAMAQTMEKIGKNLLAVKPAEGETTALRGKAAMAETLTFGDVSAIQRQAPHIEAVTPIFALPRTLKYGERTLAADVTGASPNFIQTKKHVLLAGRFIDDEDVRNRSRVTVVADKIVKILFRGEWPIGKTLMVNNIPFTIIGVLEGKGIDPNGGDEDSQIIVPHTTALRRVFNVDFYTLCLVQVSERDQMERTRQSIAQILTERHGETDFTILDQTRLLKLQANNNQGFRTLMLWLAGLALGLGGVGLMAVSLLGVKERQSEVGLRLALGARPIFVMLQFLIETLAVASFGGLAGLTFGSLGILLLSRFTQWHIALSVQAAVAPLVICLAIAVVFGAYPAYRAARLDPIIALRSN